MTERFCERTKKVVTRYDGHCRGVCLTHTHTHTHTLTHHTHLLSVESLAIWLHAELLVLHEVCTKRCLLWSSRAGKVVLIRTRRELTNTFNHQRSTRSDSICSSESELVKLHQQHLWLVTSTENLLAQMIFCAYVNKPVLSSIQTELGKKAFICISVWLESSSIKTEITKCVVFGSF